MKKFNLKDFGSIVASSELDETKLFNLANKIQSIGVFFTSRMLNNLYRNVMTFEEMFIIKGNEILVNTEHKKFYSLSVDSSSGHDKVLTQYLNVSNKFDCKSGKPKYFKIKDSEFEPIIVKGYEKFCLVPKTK